MQTAVTLFCCDIKVVKSCLNCCCQLHLWLLVSILFVSYCWDRASLSSKQWYTQTRSLPNESAVVDSQFKARVDVSRCRCCFVSYNHPFNEWKKSKNAEAEKTSRPLQYNIKILLVPLCHKNFFKQKMVRRLTKANNL